jgi:hypothetical protein
MLVYSFNDKFRNTANSSSISPSRSVLSDRLNTVRKVRSALKKPSSVKQKLFHRRVECANKDQEVQFAPMAKVVLVRKICKEECKNIWYNWKDYRSFEHERRRAVAFFQDAIENKRTIDPQQHTVAGLEKYLHSRLLSNSKHNSRCHQSKQRQSQPTFSDSKSDVDQRENSEPATQHFQHKWQPEPQYYYNYCYNYWYNPTYDYGNYTINPGYYVPKSHLNPELYYMQNDFVNTPYIPVGDFDKNKSVCISPVS